MEGARTRAPSPTLDEKSVLIQVLGAGGYYGDNGYPVRSTTRASSVAS